MQTLSLLLLVLLQLASHFSSLPHQEGGQATNYYSWSFYSLKQFIHKKIPSLFDYVSNPRLGFWETPSQELAAL